MENQGEAVSYLYARDPSILAFNRHGLLNVKTALEFGDETTIVEEEKEDDCLKVYLRVKPNEDFQNLYEIEKKTLICKIPDGSYIVRNMRDADRVTKKYTFSQIFGPESTQSDIFNNIVKPKTLAFINGHSSTLMTYGASGAGKTFTIIGTTSEPGLVPRCLEYLFRTMANLTPNPAISPQPDGTVLFLDHEHIIIEKQKRANILNASHSMGEKHARTYRAMQKRLSDEPVGFVDTVGNLSISIWVSFAEIYNEQLYDLLLPASSKSKTRPKLRLGCSNGRTYIKDLTNIFVRSGLEAYQVLQYGLHNLNYAATSINSNSSRSHSIFTIKIAQECNGKNNVTYFNFCDLAGSERSKKTRNVGERLKESNNINNSLLVLARCIKGIRDSQKHSDKHLVPFRESKLTQLFQNALSGHEDICMITNINPSKDMFDESQHVLNFCAVAKQIIVEEKPAKHIRKKRLTRFSLYMQSRSTAIQPSIAELDEDDEESVDHLKGIIEQLIKERAEMEDAAQKEKEACVQSLRNNYNKTVEIWQGIVADKEKYWQRKYNNDIEELKEELRSQGNRTKRKKVVVSLLSDDDDDDDSGDDDKRMSFIEELKELAETKKQLCELKSKEFQQQELIKNIQQQKTNLEKTLEDAEREYNQMSDVVKKLKMEIVELTEKLKEEQRVNRILSEELREKNSTVDDLESLVETPVESCQQNMIENASENISSIGDLEGLVETCGESCQQNVTENASENISTIGDLDGIVESRAESCEENMTEDTT